MKPTLLISVLLACTFVCAQGAPRQLNYFGDPKTPARKSRSQSDDRMPTFQGATPKESVVCFSQWFHNAYLKEYKLYKKQNKDTYNYQAGEFQDVVVQFYIDTLGCPRFIGSRPEELSTVQREVLQMTFASSPRWTPAVQNGRKVKFKYVMPIRE